MEKSANLPKDVFLNLLGIMALYMSAIGFITLLFQYINILVPDQLNPVFYSSVSWPIRWSMASLIIVYPVFVLVSWMLNKDYKENPEKKDLKIRKWLVYFTLFLAAVIIITDLVTLVYNFLGGDLTARFVLKVLVILAVSGTIFSYYLMDLRNKLSDKNLKALAWAVSGIILVSVIAGFFTAGSPFKARLYRFDERRVNDLQILQSEIINFWAQKDRLPSNLEELRNNITGFAPPRDPETGLEYGYEILPENSGQPSFELCAGFNLESEDLLQRTAAKPISIYESPYGYQQNWSHGTGETCFERNIDPELYRKDNAPIRF